MEKVYSRTIGIRDDMVDGFCPGCMHSTVIKLIGEVLEEMNLFDKASCLWNRLLWSSYGIYNL